MMLKVFAGGTVLFCCGMLGMLFANGYKKRVVQLVEIQNAIMQLEYDIDFLSIPLSESFEKLAKASSEGALKEIFSYIWQRLKNYGSTDIKKLWYRAFERMEGELYLNCEDKRILLDFAENLGKGNREQEKNNIKAVLMRLKICEEEARAEAKCNVKMYRGLGMLLGVFIVIVLV